MSYFVPSSFFLYFYFLSFLTHPSFFFSFFLKCSCSYCITQSAQHFSADLRISTLKMIKDSLMMLQASALLDFPQLHVGLRLFLVGLQVQGSIFQSYSLLLQNYQSYTYPLNRLRSLSWYAPKKRLQSLATKSLFI